VRGKPQSLFTLLTLNKYARRKGSHLKTVDFHVCLPFSPFMIWWMCFILRVWFSFLLFLLKFIETTHFFLSFFLGVIRRVSFTTGVQSSTPVSSWKFLTSASSPLQNKRASASFVERNDIQPRVLSKEIICLLKVSFLVQSLKKTSLWYFCLTLIEVWQRECLF
jgi:hypothetical protein